MNELIEKYLGESKKMYGIQISGKMTGDKNIEVTTDDGKSFVMDGGEWKNWRDTIKAIKKLHPNVVQIIAV